jgi:hypothetical protein
MAFKLNRAEVARQTMTRRTSLKEVSGPASGRARGLSSVRLTLVHMPTKVTVIGDVPVGHYTKKQLAGLRDELYERLIIDLEKKVAQVLRVPGQ